VVDTNTVRATPIVPYFTDFTGLSQKRQDKEKVKKI
jgi:hypothetical protein